MFTVISKIVEFVNIMSLEVYNAIVLCLVKFILLNRFLTTSHCQNEREINIYIITLSLIKYDNLIIV